MIPRPLSVLTQSRVPSISEEHEVEYGGGELEPPPPPPPAVETLEGVLFQKKHAWRGSKRRYVVLNMMEGGSLSCYHTTGRDRKAISSVHSRVADSDEHSIHSQSLCLHLPSSLDWSARDIVNKSSFIVSVEGSAIIAIDEKEVEAGDDDVSVASSTMNSVLGVDKYRSSMEADDDHMEFIFKCPHGSQEKSIWIAAFAKLNRLMSSEAGIAAAKSPRFFSSKATSRARSALSAQLAKEKMQLLGQVTGSKSGTTAALSEAEEMARKVKGDDVEFTVQPSYAYPGKRFTREELRVEMKKPSSQFHDLRVPARMGEEIGTLRVEVLQCLGLPKLDLVGESDPVVYLVCGGYAFSTDTIPDIANPMWLSKMRRACIFPLYHAYARMYVGVFDNDGEKERDDFAGRVVLDIARVRPGCTYDVTLPLRQSAHVYTRRQRGSVRLRFHLEWKSERAAMLSYLPRKLPKLQPNRSTTVRCCDETAFQNVALTVHGTHMQGRFSFKQLKATLREINFTRIMLIRLILRPEMKKLVVWENPFISLFVFCAWMHCAYRNSVAYVPGHFLTFLLIFLWKNYARYGMDGPGHRGFQPPTWEEMMHAVMYGKPGSKNQSIVPIDMQVHNPVFDASGKPQSTRSVGSLGSISESEEHQTFTPSNAEMPLRKIAELFRTNVPVQSHRHRLRTHKNVFVGTEAVDYLVNSGTAKSRKDAVKIGRSLAREYRLFEHVKKEHLFRDERLFYRFLDVSLEKYVFTTHEPKGKNLLRMLGLYDDSYVTDGFNDGHVEFPFSDFVEEYPKFTVKESLVSRLSSEKKMRRMSVLQQDLLDNDDSDMDDDGENEALEQFGDAGDSVLHELVGKSSTNGSKHSMVGLKRSDTSDLDRTEHSLTVVDASVPPNRRPPPPQNMDVVRKSEKKLTDELQKIKGRLNAIFLHWFNDKVYDIKYPDASFARSSSRRKDKKKKKQGEDDVKTRLDRSIHTGQFSHSNRAIAKVGLFIEPIIGIALIYLQGIRALYNIFTWRDPILSFWVSVICPVVVVVLHLCPWRHVLFVVGFTAFGPQNLILRVFFGERIAKALEKMKAKKASKAKSTKVEKDEPYFQSNLSGNSQAPYKKVDPKKVHHIVIPYSALMYQRFYDWPPEPEYASVVADQQKRSGDMQSLIMRSRSHRTTSSGTASTAGSKSPKSPRARNGNAMLGKLRKRK